MKAGTPGIQFAYRLGKSKYGTGVFVQEDIPKGRLLWKYKRGENVTAFKTEEEVRAFLETLPTKEEKGLWLDYAFHAGDFLNYIEDDGVYWNHSEDPNCQVGWPGK